MKISGFSIARNCRKYGYPVQAAIKAILPICDEFVINVGKSEDDTLQIIQSVQDPKVKIIETEWTTPEGSDMLSAQTNLALKNCQGDWAFYVQADEIIHERDLPRLKALMHRHLDDEEVEAFRFRWMHFFGSYYRYRVDYGWFQKQDRIVRNNGQIESCTDAWAFRRKDGQPLKIKKSGCLLYHYGWVQPAEVMTQRRVNALDIYDAPELTDEEKVQVYDYGDLNRFPAYFGSHPAVMTDRVSQHTLSLRDKADIDRRLWWHPMKILKARYKTFKRVRRRIQ